MGFWTHTIPKISPHFPSQTNHQSFDLFKEKGGCDSKHPHRCVNVLTLNQKYRKKLPEESALIWHLRVPPIWTTTTGISTAVPVWLRYTSGLNILDFLFGCVCADISQLLNVTRKNTSKMCEKSHDSSKSMACPASSYSVWNIPYLIFKLRQLTREVWDQLHGWFKLFLQVSKFILLSFRVATHKRHGTHPRKPIKISLLKFRHRKNINTRKGKNIMYDY